MRIETDWNQAAPLGSGCKFLPSCYLVWREGSTNITPCCIPPLASGKPDITKFDEVVRMFSNATIGANVVSLRQTSG